MHDLHMNYTNTVGMKYCTDALIGWFETYDIIFRSVVIAVEICPIEIALLRNGFHAPRQSRVVQQLLVGKRVNICECSQPVKYPISLKTLNKIIFCLRIAIEQRRRCVHGWCSLTMPSMASA